MNCKGRRWLRRHGNLTGFVPAAEKFRRRHDKRFVVKQMVEVDLKSEESRQMMAKRLRYIADNLEHGRITPDSFALDAEWIGTRATGRVFLKLGFWTKPLED